MQIHSLHKNTDTLYSLAMQEMNPSFCKYFMQNKEVQDIFWKINEHANTVLCNPNRKRQYCGVSHVFI